MLELAATTPSSPLASKVVVVDMRVSPLLAEWRAQAPFYTPVPALFQDNTASSCSCANLDLPHLRVELRAVQRRLEHSRVDVSPGKKPRSLSFCHPEHKRRMRRQHRAETR